MTEPREPLRAEGAFGGQAVVNNVTPPGHCFSMGLALLGGSHAFRYRLELDQTGGALAGVLEATDFDQRCQVAGSIDGNGELFLGQVGDCVPTCTTFDWTAAPGERCFLRACSDAVTIAGSVADSGAPISGIIRLEWGTFDADTDASLGLVIATGLIDLAPL